MGAVPNSFMQDVLMQIRAPATTRNVQSLQVWRAYEGGTALWNPLNDTDSRLGSTEYNSAGVQNYTSAAQGVNATADTLQNGRYTAILVRLRGDMPLPEWNDPSVLEQINTWGTHGFANYIRSLAPPSTPLPPEEDLVVICAITGEASIWVLFVNAGKYVPVASPPDIAALVTAGAKETTISVAQHQDFLKYLGVSG